MARGGPPTHAPCALCGRLLGGCYSTRQGCMPQGACSAGATVPAELRVAVALWHTFSRAFARHGAPLGTIPVGATIRAKVAPDVHIGHSPLRATAAPDAPALPDEEKSAPTRIATRWDHFFLIVRSVPRSIAWLTMLFNPARSIRSLEISIYSISCCLCLFCTFSLL